MLQSDGSGPEGPAKPPRRRAPDRRPTDAERAEVTLWPKIDRLVSEHCSGTGAMTIHVQYGYIDGQYRTYRVRLSYGDMRARYPSAVVQR